MTIADSDLILKQTKAGNLKRICIAVLIAVSVPVIYADYEIDWYTIDGGGGYCSGGQYTLMGTVGQPDAGRMNGGQYELSGGFRPGGYLCIVDLEDFAKFAEFWLYIECTELNDWCEGADLEPYDMPDGDVDLADLGELVYWWLSTCPDNWPLK